MLDRETQGEFALKYRSSRVGDAWLECSAKDAALRATLPPISLPHAPRGKGRACAATMMSKRRRRRAALFAFQEALSASQRHLSTPLSSHTTTKPAIHFLLPHSQQADLDTYAPSTHQPHHGPAGARAAQGGGRAGDVWQAVRRARRARARARCAAAAVGGGVEWSGVQRGTHAAMQQRASLLARARWTRRRVVRCRAS